MVPTPAPTLARHLHLPPAEVWGSPATPAPTPQAQPAGAGRVSAAAGMWWDPRHFRRWWDPRHRRRQQPPSPCHPTHGGHGVPPRTAAIPLLQSRDVPAVSVTLGQAGIVLFQPGVLNSLKLALTPLLHSCAGGSSPGASLPSQGGGVLAVSSSQNALGAAWPWHPKMPQEAGWDGCPQRLLGLAVPTVPPPPQCHPSALLVPRPQAGPWGNPSLGLRRVSGVRSIQSTYLLIHKLY